MKIYFIKYLYLPFVLFSCGNAGISYFLIRTTPSHTDIKLPVIETKIKPSIRLKTKEYSTYLVNEPKINIIMDAFNPSQVDEMADALGLTTTQKYYRLPGLIYFRFQVEYMGDKEMEFSFFNTYFEDEMGNQYHAISEKEYKDTYTSIAYDRFPFDTMYAFYRFNGQIEDEHMQNILSSKPSENIHLKKGTVGMQLVPFTLFSSGSRKYTYKIQIPELEINKEITFFYRSQRDD